LRARVAPLIARHGLGGESRRFETVSPRHLAETVQPTLF
jgi:hypothetical protein